MRSIAILIRSAAVPWIGMLIAARSAACAVAQLLECRSSISRRRPKSVSTLPVRRARSTVSSR